MSEYMWWLSGFVAVCVRAQDVCQVGRQRMAGYCPCLTSGQNLFRGRWCLADAFRPFSRGQWVKQVAAMSFFGPFSVSPPSDGGQLAGKHSLFRWNFVLEEMKQKHNKHDVWKTFTCDAENQEPGVCVTRWAAFLITAGDVFNPFQAVVDAFSGWCVYSSAANHPREMVLYDVLSWMFFPFYSVWLTLPQDMNISDVHPEQGKEISEFAWKQSCF